MFSSNKIVLLALNFCLVHFIDIGVFITWKNVRITWKNVENSLKNLENAWDFILKSLWPPCKCKTKNAIILVEDEKILLDEKAIANTFNNYFTDVTYSLGLKKKKIGLENT